MAQIDIFLRLEEHPNIVRFLGVATKREKPSDGESVDGDETDGEIDTTLYLVMEYVSLGSLYDMLHERRSEVFGRMAVAALAI